MAYGISNVAGKPTLDQSRAILKTALDNGITTFDTAPAYGDSERVLGRCLSEFGQETVLISKLPRLDWRLGPEEMTSQIRGILQASLANLLAARLPICLFHNLNDMYARERHAVQELLSFKNMGLVEKIGASIYTPEDAEICLRNPACEVIQVPFNAADKRLLDIDFFRRAKEKNKLTLVRSVFLQGLFFKGDLSAELQDFEPFRQRVEAIAESQSMSILELLLRYALSFEEIDSVIIGVDTIDQLLQNIEIIRQGSLPPDVVEKINGLGTAPEYIIDPRQWPKSS
jgi:aryl-alcohol dehydrogenase-like predicted oxidoreductase